MKIGIIGPLDSGKKIAEVMKRYFPSLLSPEIYDVSKVQEAHLKIEKAEKECSGLIFTGVAVYSKIVEKVKLNLPHVYIPFPASSIMKALWELKEKYPECKNISIDTVERAEVEDILEELNLNDIKIQTMPYSKLKEEQKYVDFHLSFQEKKQACVSIIGLGWVYEQVTKKGYSTLRLYSTKSGIKSTISDLLYKINAAQVKESTMAIELLNVKSEEDISQYRALEISSLIESSLVEYLKEIQGSIFSLNWNQYIIFSTRGAIENRENIMKLKNILNNLEKNNIQIFAGIGLGKTVYESEINAKKALHTALREKRSCIFKVDKNKIEGPILTEGELAYNFITDNSEVNKLAKLINLNPLYIKKLKALKEKHSKDTFTSDELAKYLDISIRSANRIIKKIIDHQCGEVVGLESTQSLGRPKKIIRIDFYDI